jgi:hypothetical protein
MATYTYGLIAGRHPLPVGEYLLTGEIDASPVGTRALFDALFTRIVRLPLREDDRVRLYLTGLTRAALLAVDLLRTHHPGVMIELVEYDQASGTYVPTLFTVNVDGGGQMLHVVPALVSAI